MLWAFGGMSLLWVLQLLLVNPHGEFSLDDDWAHTLTVFHWVQSGHWFYPAYLAPYNLLPIGYGIILSKLFGFSFTVLRCSNLVFAFLTSVTIYAIARARGWDLSLCVIAALLLWFNPLIFTLSYSFMGDVPALFFLVAALWCYERGFRNAKPMLVFCGSLLVIVGYFTRQFDILLYAAVLVTIYNYRHDRRMLAALIVPAFIFIISILLIARSTIIPDDHTRSTFARFGVRLVLHGGVALWDYVLLLSLFGLPLTVAILAKNSSLLKRKAVWKLLIVATLAFVLTRITGHDFQSDNLISTFGLGTIVPLLQGDVPSTWGPAMIYHVLQCVATLTLAINVYLFLTYWQELHWRTDYKYVFAGLYLAAIISTHGFDRYLVLLVPVWIIGLCAVSYRFGYARRVAATLLVPFVLYCFAGTYNYLSWNRVRWQAGVDLLHQGIPACEIEGGYEWDGWYLYSQSPSDTTLGAEPSPWYVRYLFPSDQMNYVISFSPIDHYRVIRTMAVPGVCSNIKWLFVSTRIQ